MTAAPTLQTIRLAPKALLHDHLDGGLRPATVLDIAGQVGYDDLPATDVDALASWFRTQSHSGSLERYLEPFSHTVAVMQTPEALYRVAFECAQDLAADSVVYAEVRFAPELHISCGLSFDDVVDTVLTGFAAGEKACAADGQPITVRCLVTAMRHAAMSREIAELAIRFRDKGVVGFDIAGAEAGHPPTRHLDAFEYMRDHNARFTIHAGEAFGLPSIHEAIAFCGADRLGHGVRIVDDIDVDADGGFQLGRLAAILRDKRIPLELVPDPGGAAFYGPKISVQVKDALGRTWQMSTIQLDFNFPERFGLEYTAADGTRHRPVMIHRALFGSIERFFGILTEHYAGAFPAWLAPVQVVGIPVADEHVAYLEEVATQLKSHGVRAEVDASDDRMAKKIVHHTNHKVPFMVLAGDRDVAAGAVSFRFGDRTQINGVARDDAVAAIVAWIADRENAVPTAELVKVAGRE